jgi:hypothetical protein
MEPPGEERFDDLPGGDLVQRGLTDLRRGRISEEALLVLIASPRLARLGIVVPRMDTGPAPHEHQLYEMLERRLDRGAHSQYNALIRRVVSFARGLESLSSRARRAPRM